MTEAEAWGLAAQAIILMIAVPSGLGLFGLALWALGELKRNAD